MTQLKLLDQLKRNLMRQAFSRWWWDTEYARLTWTNRLHKFFWFGQGHLSKVGLFLWAVVGLSLASVLFSGTLDEDVSASAPVNPPLYSEVRSETSAPEASITTEADVEMGHEIAERVVEHWCENNDFSCDTTTIVVSRPVAVTVPRTNRTTTTPPIDNPPDISTTTTEEETTTSTSEPEIPTWVPPSTTAPATPSTTAPTAPSTSIPVPPPPPSTPSATTPTPSTTIPVSPSSWAPTTIGSSDGS